MSKKKYESVKFEYTNTCTCENYDIDKDEYTPSDDCYGDCWDYVLEDFKNITEHLFDNNETSWWEVKGLQLWDRTVGGYFHADNIRDLITGMTVRSEWIMMGEVHEDRIEYSLSHHDAPMGSSTILTIITEEQREELGLY